MTRNWRKGVGSGGNRDVEWGGLAPESDAYISGLPHRTDGHVMCHIESTGEDQSRGKLCIWFGIH